MLTRYGARVESSSPPRSQHIQHRISQLISCRIHRTTKTFNDLTYHLLLLPDQITIVVPNLSRHVLSCFSHVPDVRHGQERVPGPGGDGLHHRPDDDRGGVHRLGDPGAQAGQ